MLLHSDKEMGFSLSEMREILESFFGSKEYRCGSAYSPDLLIYKLLSPGDGGRVEVRVSVMGDRALPGGLRLPRCRMKIYVSEGSEVFLEEMMEELKPYLLRGGG